MTVVPIAVRMVVILLAVAGIAGQLAYLDALWWHALGLTATVAREVGDATILLLAAHAVVSSACSVLAILLVLDEGMRARAARALALAFGAWSYLMAYSGVTLLLRPVAPGPAREIFEAHFLVVEVVGLAALLRFSTIFPRPLGPAELRPGATLPAAFVPVHRFAVFMRRAWAPWAAGAAVLVGLWSWTLVAGGDLSDAGLSLAMDLIRLSAAGLVVMNLHRAWSMSTEGDRDALMWLVAALAILIGTLTVVLSGGTLVRVAGFSEPDLAWRPLLIDAGMIGFFVGVAASVLGKGRLDPARLTRKVTAWAVVATVGLFLATALEALFTGGIVAAYTLRPGLGTVVAVAVVLSTYRTSTGAIERSLPM